MEAYNEGLDIRSRIYWRLWTKEYHETVGCRWRSEWMDLALPAMTGSFASYDGYWKAYGR